MSFSKLVKKEVFSILKNPQIIVSILLVPIMFIAMGSITSAGIRAATEAVFTTQVAVIDNDNTWLTQTLLDNLNKSLNGRIHLATKDNIDYLLQSYGIVMVIPSGFTDSLVHGEKRVFVDMYVALDSLSMASTAKLGLANRITSTMTSIAKKVIALKKGIDIGILELDIVPKSTVAIDGLKMSGEEMNAILSSIMSSGFIIAMITALVFQFGALSMAQEKEEKTFEVLLTQPVPRVQIGLAKIVGVIVISLIEAIVFGASWYYYMKSVMVSEASTGSRFDIFSLIMKSVGLSGLALLFIDILIVMIAMSTLGLVLGGLARDTKSAGMMIGPIWFIAVMGALAMQFIGAPITFTSFAILSATLLLSPVVSYIALLLGNLNVMFMALAINIVEAIVLIFLLGKFLEGETMIIGWRFSRPRARE